jgi:solute carrier family 25 phosphate transporter 23/24/25/41
MSVQSTSSTSNIETNLWWRRVFAGAGAGVMSRTATAPLERIKILRQVQTTRQYTGLWPALKSIYHQEGWFGFWKGNGVNALRIAPYNSIQFAAFGAYKNMLKAEDSPTRLICAGAMGGMTSVVCCYPLDLARATLTIQTDQRTYCGLTDTIKKVHKSNGVRGLYRGLCASLLGIAPYVSINFTMFDLLKQKYGLRKSHRYFDVMNLGLGGVSGSTAVVMTYPTDLIRRKVQMGGILGSPFYSSARECVKKIWRNEGLRGFYTGMTPSVIKIVPTMAISFMVYERVMKVLGELDGKDDQDIRGGI